MEPGTRSEGNIAQRMQELQEQSDQTVERMDAQVYGPTFQGGRHNDMIHEEGSQETKELEDAMEDQENDEREKSKGDRMTYGSQAVRPFGERGGDSRQMESYDAEGHWRLGLAADRWAIGEVGEMVWLTTLYM